MGSCQPSRRQTERKDHRDAALAEKSCRGDIMMFEKDMFKIVVHKITSHPSSSVRLEASWSDSA